jgi:hypothetical protein
MEMGYSTQNKVVHLAGYRGNIFNLGYCTIERLGRPKPMPTMQDR